MNDYYGKMIKIENKIPNITRLATSNALNTKLIEIEYEIPGVATFVKKANLNIKIFLNNSNILGNKDSIKSALDY